MKKDISECQTQMTNHHRSDRLATSTLIMTMTSDHDEDQHDRNQSLTYDDDIPSEKHVGTGTSERQFHMIAELVHLACSPSTAMSRSNDINPEMTRREPQIEQGLPTPPGISSTTTATTTTNIWTTLPTSHTAFQSPQLLSQQRGLIVHRFSRPSSAATALAGTTSSTTSRL